MSFVLYANWLLRVKVIEIVVTVVTQGVNLRNNESDADENVQESEERKVNRGSRRRRQGGSGSGIWLKSDEISGKVSLYPREEVSYTVTDA